MWIYTLITTALGVFGFGLGLWNLWRSHRQPVRDLQFERRKFLKEYCHVLHRHTSAAEDYAKKGQWPTDQVIGELNAASTGFEEISRELVVPSAKQIEGLGIKAASVSQTIESQIVPQEDSVLDGLVPEDIVSHLSDLNRDLEYVLTGLRKIEQGRTLCYKRQFKELER